MTGYDLFKHAIMRVVRNFDDALAISGLIWVGAMAIVVMLTSTIEPAAIGDTTFSSSAFLAVLGVNLTVLVAGVWVAVEWHRFALLGERPQTVIPPFRAGLAILYFGKSFMLGLLTLLALIPFSIVIAVLTSLLSPSVIVSAMFLVTAALGVLVYYIFLRMAPILPAAALGKKIIVAEAWRATGEHKATIAQAAILSVIMTFVLQLPASLVTGGVIGVLVSLVLGWIMLIVNVSLLSSIYELTQRET